jgi:nicotinamide-nucleotide amidase
MCEPVWATRRPVSRTGPPTGSLVKRPGNPTVVDAANPSIARAEDVARSALESGARIAVAESLTGGQLAAALAAAPDAATWFAGSLVAYHTDVKRNVLHVGTGSVLSARCALAMARNVRVLLQADVAVAVTGVGGPGPQEGHPAGSVWLAVVGPDDQPAGAAELLLPGDPAEVVARSVDSALQLLLDAVRDVPRSSGGGTSTQSAVGGG